MHHTKAASISVLLVLFVVAGGFVYKHHGVPPSFVAKVLSYLPWDKPPTDDLLESNPDFMATSTMYVVDDARWATSTIVVGGSGGTGGCNYQVIYATTTQN